MSTPTLRAGENPAADAAAAEHVRMLLSTGMAYEFQPETIATRAFLDGFALGAVDLARVTAERDDALYREQMLRSSERNLLEIEAFKDAQLVAAQNELSALRARVAELEKEAMILRGTVEAVTTQRQQAEQCNAELVAALRDMVAWTEPFYAHEVRDFELARDLLARAESATPDHIPDAAKMVSAMPAKLCKHCGGAGVIHDTDIDGNITGYCDCPKCSATPAKHPDTEILEWLDSAACYRWMIAVGGDREEELHKMRPWKIRDAVRYCIAARKQGGEK